jgi:hypothetical protein
MIAESALVAQLIDRGRGVAHADDYIGRKMSI